MLSVVCLAVSATDALGERSIEFALSYAAIRIILVIEYLRAGHYNREAKPLVNRFALGFSISILLWLVSLFVPAPYRFFIWVLAIVIDYLTPITAGQLHAKFPPHIHHLPERFGLFTIIVLGEIIVDIVIALNKTGLTLYSVASAFFGIVIGFIIWGLYFDGVHAAESRVLNNSNEVNKYQVWLYSHLPLTMGITSTAVGIKHLIYLKYPIAMNEGETLLLILSIVLTALCLNFIFLSQPNIGFTKETWKKIAPHFYINIVMLLTIFLIPYLAGIAILGLITFIYSLKIFYSYKHSNK